MRGMIKANMSEHYKEMLYPDLVANYRAMFREMMIVNKAHTVMLFDQGILDRESAQKILAALEDIQANFKEEDLSADNQDLYFNIEGALIDRIGRTFGGRMHTGRSRNDLYSTLARMTVRKSLLELMERVLGVARQLIALAEENTDSVMTGYTHTQPAQPTTVAHYLTAYLEVLDRDFTRLQQAYEVTNQCPLGAAAFAGTGFPLDREKTARLLGFDGVLKNTWDCVASRDYLLQAESAMGIMMSSLARVAQDLYFWCTDEVAVWEIGGEVSGQSSIMPQKKNPSTLEYIRGKAGHSMGALISTCLAFKGTPFSFCCDMMETAAFFDKAVGESAKALDMFSETLEFSRFHRDRAVAMARGNFCTVTGLADHLVRTFNISFRDAHQITGGMVADVKAAGMDVRGMTPELLRKWSRQVVGEELTVDQSVLEEVLSPYGNIQSKVVAGSPSTACVEEMIRERRGAVHAQGIWLNAAAEQVEQAYQETDRAMARVMAQ